MHFILFAFIKRSYGEMAEWSNAVDSKSIVLFTGYPGFESLSLRQLVLNSVVLAKAALFFTEKYKKKRRQKACVSAVDTLPAFENAVVRIS